MNIDEIKQTVQSYIGLAKNGQEPENLKFDFKREWWKLNEDSGISEFLKDVTAIVNPVGPDGFIAIGFDPKDNSFTNSTFKNSGLKDSAQLPDLVNRHVDRLFSVGSYDFDLDGNQMSVLHISPSIDKPHVIRLHKVFSKGEYIRDDHNRVFVRRNTRTMIASKYDLDLMYYDRKNLVPEYQIECSVVARNFTSQTNSAHQIRMEVALTIENVGRRPVAVAQIDILTPFRHPNFEIARFDSHWHGQAITIPSNSLHSDKIVFISDQMPPIQGFDRKDIMREAEAMNGRLESSTFVFRLTNGEIIRTAPIVTRL